MGCPVALGSTMPFVKVFHPEDQGCSQPTFASFTEIACHVASCCLNALRCLHVISEVGGTGGVYFSMADCVCAPHNHCCCVYRHGACDGCAAGESCGDYCAGEGSLQHVLRPWPLHCRFVFDVTGLANDVLRPFESDPHQASADDCCGPRCSGDACDAVYVCVVSLPE